MPGQEGGTNAPAGRTSVGSGRRAIEDNAPCLQEDLGSVCRTVGLQSCPRQLAGTQSVEAEDAEAVDRAHQPPDASDHRQEAQEHHPRDHAVARRYDGAPRRLCGPPLPPSSLPSTPCEFL